MNERTNNIINETNQMKMGQNGKNLWNHSNEID